MKIKYMKFINKDQRRINGFTLIELLIVISIIGILAALVTFSFTSSQRQAMDTQRKSDLSQYRTALETSASNGNGLFPASNTQVSIDALCGYLSLPSCENDPDPNETYRYCTNGNVGGGGMTATSYVLWGLLETDSTQKWIVCSDGRSGKSTLTPTCGGSFNCNIQ